MKLKNEHVSVLLKESVFGLNIIPNGTYIDASFGLGGHSKLILSKLGKNGQLIAIDRDFESIKFAKNTIIDSRFSIKHALFSQLKKIIEKKKLIGKINGILLDLGISSFQLNNPKRGFSFTHDGPLDMRMDQTQGMSAKDWLMHSKKKELNNILAIYGEEKFAKRISEAITSYKKFSKNKCLTRTKQLADLIKENYPKIRRNNHPATRTFQAIRIHINNELYEIKKILSSFLDILKIHGRFSIISFHSLEDKIIKNFLKKYTNNQLSFKRKSIKNIKNKFNVYPRLRLLGVIQPTFKEISNNPRSRSAILRIVEKIY